MAGDSALTRRVRRLEIGTLAAVLALAIGVRAAYFIQYRAAVPYADVPLMDALYYDQWAQRVVEGHGYGPSPFYLAPLYPYWLSLVYRAFGHQLAAVHAVQSTMGVMTLLLVYLLGRRLFGHWAGLAAMLLFTLYAPALFMESKPLSETLGLFLNLVALHALLTALGTKRKLLWLLAGGAAGISVICRSGNLFFVLLLLAWLAAAMIHRRDGSRLPRLAALVCGIAAAILPVTVRNRVVGGDTVLIQTNAGMTFAQGNNETAVGLFSPAPGASSGIVGQQAEEMAIASRALGRPVKPSESSAWWFRRGLEYIRTQPGDYALLLLRKALYSLNNREEQDSYETYYETDRIAAMRCLVMPFSVLFGFAVVGYVCGRRSAGAGVDLLGLYVAGCALVLLVFYMSSRYRLPAVPALAIFAGYGVVRTIGFLRERAGGRAALALLAPVCATAVASAPYPAARGNGAAALGNTAVRYLDMGDVDRGLALFHEALKIDPNDGRAQLGIGCTLLQQGKAAEARAWLLKAATRPDSAGMAHTALAQMSIEEGQLAEAEGHLRAAIRADPTHPAAHQELGRVLSLQGDLPGAAEALRTAARLAPESADVFFSLGLVRMAQGDFAAAVEALETAQRLNPASAPIRQRLDEARRRSRGGG